MLASSECAGESPEDMVVLSSIITMVMRAGAETGGQACVQVESRLWEIMAMKERSKCGHVGQEGKSTSPRGSDH